MYSSVRVRVKIGNEKIQKKVTGERLQDINTTMHQLTSNLIPVFRNSIAN
jgi:hypothetical protein